MTVSLGLHGSNLTTRQMEAAAEARIAKLSTLADELLQGIDGAYVTMDELLRHEARGRR
ncbi:MAG: hypothetical protein V3T84_00915 [Phycisphaerales bacterium]